MFNIVPVLLTKKRRTEVRPYGQCPSKRNYLESKPETKLQLASTYGIETAGTVQVVLVVDIRLLRMGVVVN